MVRINKINEQLKREISIIIQQELQDPRLAFLSITAVDTSKDLKHAKVFFSVLGSEQKLKQAQDSLKSARGLIRKMVAQRVIMRYNPELIFIYDDSIEQSFRLEQTLKEIKEEDEKKKFG